MSIRAIPAGIFGIAVVTLFATGAALAENRPAWRGPAGTGISSDKALPTKWGEKENVRWRVDLPERGNSSPVVWGDRVFVTQAVSGDNRRTLMCFNRADGKLLWQSGVTYADPPKSELLATNSVNESTNASLAASDGELFLRTDSALWCFGSAK